MPSSDPLPPQDSSNSPSSQPQTESDSPIDKSKLQPPQGPLAGIVAPITLLLQWLGQPNLADLPAEERLFVIVTVIIFVLLGFLLLTLQDHKTEAAVIIIALYLGVVLAFAYLRNRSK